MLVIVHITGSLLRFGLLFLWCCFVCGRLCCCDCLLAIVWDLVFEYYWLFIVFGVVLVLFVLFVCCVYCYLVVLWFMLLWFVYLCVSV